MSAELALFTRLSTHSGLSALISTRCYPLLMPQKAIFPNVVYQRISSTEQNGTSTIRETRFQISCWGVTYSSMHSIATQVRAALEGYSDLTIKMARVVNQLDDYEDDTATYRRIIDVILTIHE